MAERHRYLCPITTAPMQDPVMDPDGHNFERAAIESWLQKHGTCPVGRESLSPDRLFPNRALKEEIEEFLTKPSSDDAPATSPPAPSSAIDSQFGFSAPPPPSAPPGGPPVPPRDAWMYSSAPPRAPSPPPPHTQYGLTQEQYDRIMTVFLTFDRDDSGGLDRSEITQLCRYLNYPSASSDIDRIFSAADNDRDGSISLHEFCLYMRDHRPRPEVVYGLSSDRYEEIMYQVCNEIYEFHVFDSDLSGSLDCDEFMRLCAALEYTTTAAAARDLFAAVDVDRDGHISAHEFLTFMRANPISKQRPWVPRGDSGRGFAHWSPSAPPPPAEYGSGGGQWGHDAPSAESRGWRLQG